MQNVVGPTPVAMATKFRLGAEIQSPTGLYTHVRDIHTNQNAIVSIWVMCYVVVVAVH